MTFCPLCIFVPSSKDGSTSTPPWVPGFLSKILGKILQPFRGKRTSDASSSVYWLCVFPSCVVPLSDDKQDLFIFSFYSLFSYKNRSFCSCQIDFSQGKFVNVLFWVPYILDQRASSPWCSPFCFTTALLVLVIWYLIIVFLKLAISVNKS